MNLEDHLGDIVSKARLQAGAPPDAVSRAAGLTPSEWASLEETGIAPSRINWPALGSLLRLHPGKLEEIAKGWRPAPVDVGLWRELRPITTAGTSYTVNCYLVWDEVTREAALFDTGFDADPLFSLVDENQLQLLHVFFTHNHSDHTAALRPIRERFPKARLHSNLKSAPPDQRNRANAFVHLGSLRITNRETPGHSEDSVTYMVGMWPEDAPHVAIVGDALFAGSMGRSETDGAMARQKVREQILSLPPETLICPGHGPLTTVAEEREHNPFF